MKKKDKRSNHLRKKILLSNELITYKQRELR